MKRLKRNRTGFAMTRTRVVGGVAIDVASWKKRKGAAPMFQIAAEDKHIAFLSPRGMRRLHAVIGRHLLDVDGAP